MVDPIDLNGAAAGATAAEPIDLNIGLSQPNLTPDVIAQRAARGSFGLSDQTGKSYQDFYQSIANGQEQPLRQELTASLNYKQQMQRYQTMQDFATMKGHPLTDEDVNNLQAFIDVSPNDPKTVVESNYSASFLGALKNTPGAAGSWYADAAKEQPQVVEQAEANSNDFLTKKMYATQKREDAEGGASEQGWLGWGVNKIEEAIPGFNEYNLRGNVSGSSRFQGTLGTQLQNEATQLLRKPMPQYTAEFDQIMNRLSKTDPGLAVQFAHFVEGASASETMLNDLFTPIDAASVYGIAKGAVGLTRTLMGKAVVMNDIRRVNKEMIQAEANTAHQPIPVVAAAAAGDLGKAAEDKIVANVIASMNGASDAEKEVIEAMPSGLRADEAAMKADPGRFGQEIVNRWAEQAQTFRENFLQTVANITRVERLPGIVSVKKAVQAVKEDIINDYPGIKNSILDLNSTLKIDDLQHNRITNTYDIELQFGRHTGEYFLSKAEAEHFAELYGLPLKGSITAEQQLRKTFLENSLKEANEKLTQYKIERGITKSASDLGLNHPTPELDARIDNIEKGIPNFQKELTSIVGSGTGAEVKPKGWAFYLSVRQPLDETKSVVRDLLVQTKMTKTPDSMLNSFVGWLRTPDETLSQAQNMNRKVASYTGSVLLKLAKEEAQSIRKLTKWALPGTEKKTRFLEWERAVKVSRDMLDKDGNKGYFFQSPGELDSFYRTTFQRGVTEPEVEAYQSFVRLVEMDRVMRNTAMYRNMSRLGTKQHSLWYLDEQGNKVASPFFPGIEQRTFPIGEDGMVVMGDHLGEESYYAVGGSRMNAKAKKNLEDEIAKGERKVLRVYDPETRPLSGFLNKDHRVRYIITNKSESKPLNFDQIPRRGGGHFDFDYDHYIKQANMRFDQVMQKWVYEGDSTVMPMQNRVLGRRVAGYLEEVRLAMAAKDMTAAKAAAGKIPAIPWEDIQKWFKPSRNPKTGKMIPPRLNIHEPIQVVPKGQMIADIDKSLENRYTINGKNKFKDGTKSGSDARQFQVEYSGQRDSYEVYTLNDEGSLHNPLYKYEPATLVDPIPTLNRSLTKIVNSTFMDDYKIFSVEHWLAEAGDHLEDDWKQAPFSVFHQGKFKRGTDPGLQRQLEDARFKIKQFIGTSSALQNVLDDMAQRMADAIYTKFGAGDTKFGRAIRLAPSTMISRLTDPVTFAHTVTYHAVIGLWSLPQIMVQSMTYVTILGLAGPESAMKGTLGAALHQFSRLNRHPNIIEHMDKIASRMGYRPGEWKEAMTELGRTGFENVGGEHILRDGSYAPKVIQNGVNSFLDAGTIFFKGSERNARYGAWYTAFKEFRDANPVGKITQLERNSILERAEMLSGNMSRASKSALQTGVMSFPSQFLAYQMRLAELFTGHRITMRDRARLLATYSVIYGVPTAAGVAAFPITDIFRQQAKQNGYVVGDNWLSTTMMEGVPAMLGQLATGNVYNVGDRYGSPGVPLIRDILASDKPWWNLLGGVSWNTLSTAFEQSDGFRTAMMSAIRNDGNAFPIRAEDGLDILKVISSYNAANRMLVAMNTGRWMSKNENYISDVSPMNAFFQTVTGMQTQQASDIGNTAILLKDRKAYEQDLENHFIKEFRRGLHEQESNPTQARDSFTRAFSVLNKGGYPNEKVSSAIALALQDNESLVNRLNWDFYLKNVPQTQKDSLMMAYNRTQHVAAGN